MNLLNAEIPVTIFDIERASLDKGISLARSAYQRDRRMSLLAGTVNLHHLKDCDLIIEERSS